MGLRRKLHGLASALGFLERERALLQTAVLELGNELLAALGRCRNAAWPVTETDVVGPCACASCHAARERIRLYADAMAALQAEERALAAKLPGGPRMQ